MGQFRPIVFVVGFLFVVLGACTAVSSEGAGRAVAPSATLGPGKTTSTTTLLASTTEDAVIATQSQIECSEDELVERVLIDDAEAVLELLGCGVDPNLTFDGMPMLHLATIRDHAPTVTMLVLGGADSTATNSLGTTALMEAARQNAPSSAFALLDLGVDPEQPFDDAEGRKAIHVAAANGSVDVLNVFIENGLNVETPDNFGNHALIFAIIANQPEFVDALLDTGVDPDLPGGKGLVAMDHAIAWNLPDVMESIRAARWLRPAAEG